MLVRQAFAGSAQALQALCGDYHGEKTLRERAAHEPESRVMEQYARGLCKGYGAVGGGIYDYEGRLGSIGFCKVRFYALQVA